MPASVWWLGLKILCLFHPKSTCPPIRCSIQPGMRRQHCDAPPHRRPRFRRSSLPADSLRDGGSLPLFKAAHFNEDLILVLDVAIGQGEVIAFPPRPPHPAPYKQALQPRRNTCAVGDIIFDSPPCQISPHIHRPIAAPWVHERPCGLDVKLHHPLPGTGWCQLLGRCHWQCHGRLLAVKPASQAEAKLTGGQACLASESEAERATAKASLAELSGCGESRQRILQ